ncbi:hypothetical protein Patl1_23813 [Pistacia atlantica]|uniref:Uncharacterized protein n=1 Tax=Pistacia atlantica TaxID=434234 RepID=A0ACC0ZZX1_9ROSI|nr:hypothetical protein Patl1_23813 [Pistacia atlantica]
MGVTYYVKSKEFEEKYPASSPERQKIEDIVDKDYLSILTHNCRMERLRQSLGLTNDTPHCSSYEKFNSKDKRVSNLHPHESIK